MASIVELALEEYEARHSGERSAAEFYRGLRAECAVESDLDTLLESNRKPHSGLDL